MKREIGLIYDLLKAEDNKLHHNVEDAVEIAAGNSR